MVRSANLKYRVPEEQPDAKDGKFALEINRSRTTHIVGVEFSIEDERPTWEGLPQEFKF